MMIMILSMLSFISSMLMINMNLFIMMSFPLINSHSYNIPMEMLLDWTSLLFFSTVMFISSMIITFSIYYIPKKEHKMFSLLLLMFVTSMSILIFSNNMFMLIIGWDGLGLSSYILVVYYQNYSTASSGSITLLSNRIGDIMILMSMGMMFFSKNWNLLMNKEFPLIILILLLVASCTKSAQFPFSAWLPMAMAAPTPISALVHSSTLVTAGVFLMMRITNNIHPNTLFILMMISSATAIYASMSANWEQDMKKIIALSTLSQIAMMMFAIAINSFNIAFMHLIIHALFKSLMFMCAGIMIHESSYQDMRMMDLNFYNIPLVMSTLGITTLSLMGLPFMSGFFSKDIIIEMLISSKLNCMLSIMMIISIGMTISYSLRMITLSNKFLIKMCPNMMNHHSSFYNLPLLIMSAITIISGSSMLWMSFPDQMLFMPLQFKFSMLITIMLSLMLGFMMTFKTPLFMLLGKTSISLWFNHIMSTLSSTKLSPLMLINLKNDLTWKENYGPNNLFNMNKYMSNIIQSFNYSLLMILLLMSTIPMMIIML